MSKQKKEVFNPIIVIEITECDSFPSTRFSTQRKELHTEWKKWQHSGSEDYLINSLPVFVKVTELKTLKSLLQKRAGITFFNYGAGDSHTLLSEPTNPCDSV